MICAVGLFKKIILHGELANLSVQLSGAAGIINAGRSWRGSRHQEMPTPLGTQRLRQHQQFWAQLIFAASPVAGTEASAHA